MKILGIGTDIVEILRIKNLIKNKSFIKRIFTKSEILNSEKTKSKANYFSKRFAGKRSISKSHRNRVQKKYKF